MTAPETSEAQVLSERRGSTLILTLNNPARRNALNPHVVQGLEAGFAEQENDREIRAIVLTGAGGHFCSGGDLSAMDLGRGAKRVQFDISRKLALQIASASVPVVSAVEGWAAGAGFGFALLGDTIVASREAGFLPAFPKVGLIPDYGLLETLPRRIGLARAKQILLYARTVKGPEALDIGLVDELVEPGATLDRALELAGTLTALAPRPLRAIKDYYALKIAPALDFERLIQPELLLSDDAAEGRAAFLEKRPPEFKDR
ncbi:enoyl-CoA hydratase/isomerase family protein [Amorphus sp. 3PC139-8]|uniref:enoyl-CoA hydratase/isomerase family protein n=1 Tax=Amorphus sp. 3PC139-8 TaxID=2735676 RepID=UPI00345CAA41